MACVQSRLFEPGLTVKKVRRACGVRDRSISSQFTYYVGEGIKAYIIRHQLTLAKQLLRYDKLKIIEIAHAVGYDHSAFTQEFRRREGCTPSEYRKMLRRK